MPNKSAPIIKPSLKRYLILILFAINSGNKTFQWIQLSANTKKMSYYFGVENFIINGSAVLFLAAFVILSLPACYIIERLGLRNSVVLSSFGTAIGTIIKCFGSTESGVYLFFTGLVTVSLSEQLIFSVPSRLASVWFPDEQVSTAVSICVFGNQMGIALGFLLPQLFLDGLETKEDIGAGLLLINEIVAFISVCAFIADWIFFDECPKHAPGLARLKQIDEEAAQAEHKGDASFSKIMSSIVDRIRELFSNKDFLLLNLSFGISISLTYALPPVLSQLLEPIWPGKDMQIGRAGFIVIIFGTLASPIMGKLMDRWRKYKLMNLLLTIGACLSFIIFGLAIEFIRLPIAVYAAAALVGIHQTGLLIVGLELAVELTYPAPEILTATLMYITPSLIGIPATFFASYLADNYGRLATIMYLVVATSIAFILIASLKESLKRQSAVKI